MATVDSPIWHLVTACPVCGQGSALVIVACPRCAHVSLVCDEEGSAFRDVRPLLTDLAVDPTHTQCPVCSSVPLCDFINASDSQVRGAGIGPDEYA
jgi:hypothetical protein